MYAIQRFLLLFVVVTYCEASSAPKIGIIGGGIGGTSVAYFLQELFERKIDRIDIFENKKVGGRVAVENLGGCDYEAGGTILHPKNKYMSDFLELFSLKKKQGQSSAFGLFNGEEFAYVEDSYWSTWNTIKLLLRYGLDTLRLKQYIDTMLESFSRIYTFQENKQSYNTVEDMLNAMKPDFVKYLNVTAKEGFKEAGFSDRTIDELVLASLLVNYGQTTSVHGFVGSVSVAGAMPGLWGVKGGNDQIPLKLLESSKASLIRGEVKRITLVADSESYVVTWTSEHRELKKGVYDIVIIATPLTKNMKKKIEFVNLPYTEPFPDLMHQTVATFLVGDLNTSYFGLDSSNVNEIFSINSELFFNAIGEIHPVDESKSSCREQVAWKIFSSYPLKEEQLQKLFSNIQEVKSVSWLAYPEYGIGSYNRTFILNKNLYYINAIEWAASAMEMSVIGSKNVALLAFNNWTGKSNVFEKSKIKSEL